MATLNGKTVKSKFVSPHQKEGVSDNEKTLIIVAEDDTQITINGGMLNLQRQLTSISNQIAQAEDRKAEIEALIAFVQTS
jgi:hypothetical protein